jgi:glyoxylase-like metal-dependent hydrolase (beta-lactamase superfamily II)
MLAIGPLKLHLLQTESMLLDGGAMFGVIPKTLWSKEIPADEQNRIRMPTRPLLIEAGKRVILVDAGIGDKGDAKFNKIYDVRGRPLAEELPRHGFTPDQITDVVITHFHFDHCGGLTRKVNGKLALTLPKARYHVQKQAVENTLAPNPREQSSFFPANIEPILDSGRVEQLEGNTTLAEGIELITQFGHTIAMQIVKITAEGRTFLFPCDTIPSTAHLRVSWVAAYDILPVVTMREKNSLLKSAILEKWTLIYTHDPKIEASAVLFDGKHFAIADALNV